MPCVIRVENALALLLHLRKTSQQKVARYSDCKNFITRLIINGEIFLFNQNLLFLHLFIFFAMFSHVFKFNARSIATVLKILRNLHYVGFKFNHKFKAKVQKSPKISRTTLLSLFRLLSRRSTSPLATRRRK